MKKISLFALIITAIFTSCSSDDDTPNTVEITEANLVGKWQITAIEENGILLKLDECEKKDLSSFFISESEEKIASFTENIEENNSCKEFISNNYSWTLTDGNILTTTFGTADTDTYTIIELTKSTLKLKSEDKSQVNGQTVTDVYIETYTYLGEPEIPEDNSSLKESDLIGKWELIELSENGVIEEVECPNNDILEFFENNQATFTIFREGKLDNAGEVFRVCVETAIPDIANWSLTENDITFDFGGGDMEEAEITKISNSRLVLKYTYEDEGRTFEDIEVYKRSVTN